MTDRETIVLSDELDRLDEKAQEYAELLWDEESDSQAARILQNEANEIDQAGAGLATLIDEHGTDAEITIAGLTAGAESRVTNRVDHKRNQLGRDANLRGDRRNCFVAAGLADATFLDTGNDYGSREHFLDALKAVEGLNVTIVKYLHSRINEITTPDQGNWTPLSERLKDIGADSTNQND